MPLPVPKPWTLARSFTGSRILLPQGCVQQLTLHKSVYRFIWNRSKTVDYTRVMLDAGYLMPDVPEFAGSEIQKYPDFGELSRVVSRIKYPGSCNIANGFHPNVLSQRKHFMQIKG